MHPAVYDRDKTYQWNYEHAPLPVEDFGDVPPPVHQFCGLPVASPLGVAAGPLLNGRWVLHYAALGFDVLTYKTVRSCQRPCYAPPNLQPVAAKCLAGYREVIAQTAMHRSWAISFGMPSQPPSVWRADIEWTRRRLPSGKLLSVSVVATPEDDWTIQQLATDYAQCAAWAVESGADAIELNFSCPNVASADGQLYQLPAMAAEVAQTVHAAVGSVPRIVKLGQVATAEAAAALILALAPHVTGLSMTNCISAVVRQGDRMLFDGEPRGIGGAAILDASVTQLAMFHDLLISQRLPLQLIGVGGVFSAQDVHRYRAAGASAVQLASSVMLDPLVGKKIQGQVDW